MTALFEVGMGRHFAVYLLGVLGEAVLLGVNATDPTLKYRAAEVILGAAGGEAEDGSEVCELVTSRRTRMTARWLWPRDRGFQHAAWRVAERRDPLKLVFQTLEGLPADLVAGIAVAVRPVPGAECLCRVTAFASGNDADATVAELVGSYGLIGVSARQPLLPGRAIEHCLRPRVTYPWRRMRSDVASLFWHPAYDPTQRPRLAG